MTIEKSLKNSSSAPEAASAEDCVRLLDPHSVRMSSLPNRDPDAYTSASYLQLQASVLHKGGNVQPAKVRVVRFVDGNELGQPFHEVVYGNRRLHACQHHNLLFRALVVEEMDDQTALAERVAENHARADFSALEFGRICRYALRNGHADSQKQLATLYGKDESNVSKAVMIAGLPEEVIAAFNAPSDLQYRFAKRLNDAVDRDLAAVLEAVSELKREVGKKLPSEIWARLAPQKPREIGPSNSPGSRPLLCNGVDLGRIAQLPSGGVHINVTMKLDAQVRSRLEKHILSFLSKNLGQEVTVARHAGGDIA